MLAMLEGGNIVFLKWYHYHDNFAIYRNGKLVTTTAYSPFKEGKEYHLIQKMLDILGVPNFTLNVANAEPGWEEIGIGHVGSYAPPENLSDAKVVRDQGDYKSWVKYQAEKAGKTLDLVVNNGLPRSPEKEVI